MKKIVGISIILIGLLVITTIALFPSKSFIEGKTENQYGESLSVQAYVSNWQFVKPVEIQNIRQGTIVPLGGQWAVDNSVGNTSVQVNVYITVSYKKIQANSLTVKCYYYYYYSGSKSFIIGTSETSPAQQTQVNGANNTGTSQITFSQTKDANLVLSTQLGVPKDGNSYTIYGKLWIEASATGQESGQTLTVSIPEQTVKTHTVAWEESSISHSEEVNWSSWILIAIPISSVAIAIIVAILIRRRVI